MWAQYANRSSGCCIVFNREKLKKIFGSSSDEYYLFDGPVEYVDLLKLGDINKKVNVDVYKDFSKSGIVKHLKKNVKQLYFCKDKDWSDEMEYRFLLLNKEENRSRKPYYMSIKNNIDCIILGENHNSTMDFIIEKCDKEGINLFKLNNSLGEYSLNRVK